MQEDEIATNTMTGGVSYYLPIILPREDKGLRHLLTLRTAASVTAVTADTSAGHHCQHPSSQQPPAAPASSCPPSMPAATHAAAAQSERPRPRHSFLTPGWGLSVFPGQGSSVCSSPGAVDGGDAAGRAGDAGEVEGTAEPGLVSSQEWDAWRDAFMHFMKKVWQC